MLPEAPPTPESAAVARAERAEAERDTIDRRWQAAIAELRRVQGQVAALREALVDSGKCDMCRGKGEVWSGCSDTQHGYSTWDHGCNDHMVRCDYCHHGYKPEAAVALANTEAAAKAHDQRMRLEGARELARRWRTATYPVAPDTYPASTVDDVLADMEREAGQ